MLRHMPQNRNLVKQIPIGTVFGRLQTISPVHSSDATHRRTWVTVQCACGTTRDVMAGNLASGNTMSCGCAQREAVSAMFTIHGGSAGYRKHRLYRIWRGMHERCYNEKARNYRWYGAKGVRVCDAWRDDFSAFKAWALAAGYADGLELDRERSEDNYAPENCRWVTKKQNLRNRDLAWDDELDAKLVAYAAAHDLNPYEVIAQAVAAFIGGLEVRQ